MAGFIAISPSSSAKADFVFSGTNCLNVTVAVVGCFGSGSLTITPISNVGAPTNIAFTQLTVGTGNPATTLGQVSISGSGARTDVTSSLTVGNTAAGFINVSGGGLLNASGAATTIGSQVGSQGYIGISGAGSQFILSNTAVVGSSGPGALSVSGGGTATGSILLVGTNNGSTGNVVQVDGVGSAINLSGASAGVSLGSGNGAQGALRITNGGHLNINSSGTGTVPGFTVGGRTSTGSGTAIVDGAGSQILISGDSTSTLYPGFTVGRGGSGDLQILNGGKITITNNAAGTGGFNVGGIAGSAGNGFPVGTGTITVSGPGSSLDIQAIHGNFDIGSRSGGVGTVLVNNGGVIRAEQGTLGLTAGSTGTLTISGTGSAVRLQGDDGTGGGAILRVGQNGQGTLNVLSGAQLAILPTSTSSFGGLVAAGTSAGTGGGTATINVSGGSIVVNGGTSSRFSLGGDTGGNATLNVTGGGQVIVAPASGSAGGVYIGRATGSTASATVSGSGSLLDGGNFLGIGVATDQVSNSGFGTLTLQSGGTASASAIRIGSLGKITGAGNLTGNLTDAGGTIALGFGSSTFGQIGVNGNFSIPVGNINLDVGGTASQSHDSLRVSGAANLSGGTLNISFSNGYQPHAGDQIQLITAGGGFTGAFNPAITFSQPEPLPYSYNNGAITFSTPVIPPVTNPPSASSSPSVVTLADLSKDIYGAGQKTTDGYVPLAGLAVKGTGTNGFSAAAYTNGTNIIIAVRGTFPDKFTQEFAYNLVADGSFLGGSADPILADNVRMLADLVVQVHNQIPAKDIIITGHSLGGAIAQIVGNAAHVQVTSFDAPGAAGLLPSLSSMLISSLGNKPLTNLSLLGIGSPTSEITNYRLYGDQVSLVDSQIATKIITVGNISPNATVDGSLLPSGWLDNHVLETLQDQLQKLCTNTNAPGCVTITNGEAGKNIIGTIQRGVQAIVQVGLCNVSIITCFVPASLAEKFAFAVISGATEIILDPGPGNGYLLLETPGSPSIMAIHLPHLDGVAGWEVQFHTSAGWSAPQPWFQDGSLMFPSGDAEGVAFVPLDVIGNLTFNSSPFAFGLEFSDVGQVSLDVTNFADLPEPPISILLGVAVLFLLHFCRRRQGIRDWQGCQRRTQSI